MATYDITLSDPLNSGFLIQPGGFNGPGGTQSNSSLRLYGRGALEWGEAVDENLIRLAETFGSSSPPISPISGQLWNCIRYYFHDSTLANNAGWWWFNPSTNVWARLNGTGIVATSAPGNPTIGSYYLNTGDNMLYRWDTAYKQAGAAWMPRHFTNAVPPGGTGTAPTASPEHNLLVYNAYTNSGSGQWIAPITVFSGATAPDDPKIGSMWFNTTTNRLNLHTGTAWTTLLGPGGNQSISGDLDMTDHYITNLANGVIASGNKQATNGGVVYNYVTAEISALTAVVSGAYLLKTGGTISGNLTVTGSTTLPGGATISAATVTTTLGVTGLTTLSGGANVSSLTVTGAAGVTGITTLSTANVTTLNVSGNAGVTGTATVGTVAANTVNIGGISITGSNVNMNNQYIHNVADPSANQDAATKKFVVDSIAAVSGGLSGLTAANTPRINPGSPKDGDILLQSSKIYIYYAGWKQVYPAVYS